MITRSPLGAELIHMVKLLDQYESVVEHLLDQAIVLRERAMIPDHADLENGVDLPALRSQLEHTVIRRYLVATGFNVKRTAELLGLQRTTLLDRMRKFGLTQASCES